MAPSATGFDPRSNRRLRIESAGEDFHVQVLPDRVKVQIEVPKGGFIKRRAHRGVDFLSPFPCPFNYGSVLGSLSPDGDPLDAVVLGPRQSVDHVGTWQVYGVVDFIDAGLDDPKLICGRRTPSSAQWWTVVIFFRSYAIAKRVLNKARGKQGTTAVRGWRRR
ncbi:MAG: hypothetical protein GWP91_04225 [Rhodobacterales bacterium]|nr:hypothetical protein [Rhodobacterales bacterium]